MYWLAQCHTKWLRGCIRLQHPAGLVSMLPDSLQLAISTKPGKPWIHTDQQKKLVKDLSFLATLNLFLCAWLSFSGWQDLPEFLTANLWLIHAITLDIDGSWDTFTLHKFNICSMLIKQLIDIRKLKTENFRTNHQDLVMDVSNKVDDYFQIIKLLKNL